MSVVLAFLLWSTLGVVINTTQIDIALLVSAGSFIGLIVVYIVRTIVSSEEKQEPSYSWELLALLCIGALKGVIWFRSLAMIPVATAMIIHNFAPFIAMVISLRLNREQPQFSHIIATLIGLVGLGILLKISVPTALSLGVIFASGSAVLSGFQDGIQRRLSQRGCSGNTQSMIFILGQAIGNLIFLSPVGLSVSWADAGYIMYFGIVGTALPIMLLSKGFAKLTSWEVGTIGYIEPVFGAILALIFLQQGIDLVAVIGSTLIIISGISIVRLGKKLQE